MLCENLMKNKTIHRLNLSKNYITNGACKAIASMITRNSALRELYLHWNQIKAEGGALICEALEVNENIKVVDFSHNNINCIP